MYKRSVLVLALTVMAVLVFAQETVRKIDIQAVSGKVEREVSAGKWKTVTLKAKLTEDTVIRTGLDSKLVVTIDGDKVIIGPAQKGTLRSLIAVSGGAIKVGDKPTESDVNANSDQKRTNISTASTRAEHPETDVQWVDGKEKE